MEETEEGDLNVTCTMKCLEVGTIGGGTILKSQNTNLNMLKCAGGNMTDPGRNAKRFAEIICGTVMAGELSLLAALCTHELVGSHMTFNRSKLNLSVTKPQEEIQKPIEGRKVTANLRVEMQASKDSDGKESLKVGCAQVF